MPSYRCSNGHTFESKAKVRAFCPECGESVRRSFETGPADNENKTTESDSKTSDNSTSTTESGEKPSNGEDKTQTETDKPKGDKDSEKQVTKTRVKRVRYRKREPERRHTQELSEAEKKRRKLIKMRRIRTKAKRPVVRGRVKTNKEVQEEKEQKPASMWQNIKKKAWF